MVKNHAHLPLETPNQRHVQLILSILPYPETKERKPMKQNSELGKFGVYFFYRFARPVTFEPECAIGIGLSLPDGTADLATERKPACAIYLTTFLPAL
jgi:hypothetical protein